MNTALSVFDFETSPVRVLDRDGQPWFVLADVCRALEIANPRDAAQRLDPDERDTLDLRRAEPGMTLRNSEGQGSDTVGISDGIAAPQVQQLTIINESGLYVLILRSHGALKQGSVAHRFRKWVTAEVLPTIRRTGRYEAGREDLSSTDAFADLLETASSLRGPAPGPVTERADSLALAKVVEARRTFGPVAARIVWKMVGLPWDAEMDDPPAVVSFNGERQDSVSRFAREGIEDAPGVTTPSFVLWNAYQDFCRRNGLETNGERSFYTRLCRFGFRKSSMMKKPEGRAGQPRRMSYYDIRPRPSDCSDASGGV